jgi:DNA-binding transcriptional ArsR family regulator
MTTSSTVQAPPLPVAVHEKKIKHVRAGLPTEEVVTEAVEVFHALSNPMRLRLMHALAHDELCVGDIAHALGLSMSAVSHQLAFLRHLKLVAAREVGRQSFYRVVDENVGRLVHDCLAHVGGARPGQAHRHPHRVAKRAR